jgi:ATP-dependent exoDNAse (exonuclease V) alpha subunit
MYIGKYQFGRIALKDIRLKIDMEEFAQNPNIWPERDQDEALRKLLKNNWHYLRRYHQYEGDVIDGVKLTKSAMLAGSHLVGNKAVKRFIESRGRKNATDANGVSVRDYMLKFNNYEIEL